MHELFIVVGTLRTAKNRGTCMIIHRVRERIAKSRTPDIERIAKLCQRLTDAAGRRMLLVQNEKDGFQHISNGDSSRKREAD
jgi:hypothetical protein